MCFSFNFGAPANEVKTNKNMQLKARRLISYVYKCHACSLCFHQQEAMFQHLSNCSPSKKITKILCICGLDFDKQNYEYHCEVHRKCTTLKRRMSPLMMTNTLMWEVWLISSSMMSKKQSVMTINSKLLMPMINLQKIQTFLKIETNLVWFIDVIVDCVSKGRSSCLVT